MRLWPSWSAAGSVKCRKSPSLFMTCSWRRNHRGPRAVEERLAASERVVERSRGTTYGHVPEQQLPAVFRRRCPWAPSAPRPERRATGWAVWASSSMKSWVWRGPIHLTSFTTTPSCRANLRHHLTLGDIDGDYELLGSGPCARQRCRRHVFDRDGSYCIFLAMVLPRRLDEGMSIQLFDGHQHRARECAMLMTIKQ